MPIRIAAPPVTRLCAQRKWLSRVSFGRISPSHCWECSLTASRDRRLRAGLHVTADEELPAHRTNSPNSYNQINRSRHFHRRQFCMGLWDARAAAGDFVSPSAAASVSLQSRTIPDRTRWEQGRPRPPISSTSCTVLLFACTPQALMRERRLPLCAVRGASRPAWMSTSNVLIHGNPIFSGPPRFHVCGSRFHGTGMRSAWYLRCRRRPSADWPRSICFSSSAAIHFGTLFRLRPAETELFEFNAPRS